MLFCILKIQLFEKNKFALYTSSQPSKRRHCHVRKVKGSSTSIPKNSQQWLQKNGRLNEHWSVCMFQVFNDILTHRWVAEKCQRRIADVHTLGTQLLHLKHDDIHTIYIITRNIHTNFSIRYAMANLSYMDDNCFKITQSILSINSQFLQFDSLQQEMHIYILYAVSTNSTNFYLEMA